MATVFSNNVVEIAVIQEYAGQPAVNVWHMYHQQELTGPDVEAVVRDFANNWQDHMTELQDSDVSITEFRYRSLDPADGSLGVITPDPGKPTAGQQPGEGMPPNVALLVKKNTSDRARGQRDGRSFLVGVGEGIVDQRGTITPSLVTSWNAILASFYNGISDTGTVVGGWDGDSYPVVLATTPASRAPGTTPVTIDSRRVTSITLDPLVSTQRDRLR